MIKTIKRLAESRRIEWKKHALKRLLERGMNREQVFAALASGEILEEHEVRRPLPTFLLLGYHKGQALHVVVAVDAKEEALWVTTIYRPSPDEWEADNRMRKRR